MIMIIPRNHDGVVDADIEYSSKHVDDYGIDYPHQPVAQSSKLLGEVQFHLLAVVPSSDVFPRVFVPLLAQAHV